MLSSLFWQGALVGISIAAPIGPMCIFCIRKSINEGLYAGFAIALGIATADALYALLATQGIAAITSFLHTHATTLTILGSTIIAYLGYTTLKHAMPNTSSLSCSTQTLYKTYLSALALTLASPMTIALFMAFFTRLDASSFARWDGALSLSTGVAVGAFVWFIGLSVLVHAFRSWFTPKKLYYMNILSGILLVCFALTGILSIWA